MKYMPKLLPNVKLVEYISNSFMKRIGAIVITCVILFWLAVWLHLNKVNFNNLDEKKGKRIAIGTISV